MSKKGDNKKILELASKFSKHDVGYGRDKDGRLPGWAEWAANHPEKERSVQICNGRVEWERINSTKSQDLLSIVSWNVLSATWYEKEVRSGAYTHTPREYGIWDGRFPIFLRWISCLRPDILMVQEVDFDKFESHFLPHLGGKGYDGLVQRPKNLSADQPCGVATFWLKEKLELLDQKLSSSRSMAIHFRYKENENKQACIVNVHLESSQSEEGAGHRARQLNSGLEWASRVAPSSPVFVGGDCNTGADADLFHVLRTHQWHGHSFASVYEHPATASTLPVNRATFAVPDHHYVIDHMLYSHDTASLRVALSACTQNEIDTYLGPGFDKGFPNEFCPSDHLPIGAIFDVQEIQGEHQPKDTKLTSAEHPFSDHDLTKALDSAMTKYESLESYFARDCRNEIILLLAEEIAAELGGRETPDDSTERACIAKFVKKNVGKAYGKWLKHNP